MSRKMLRARRVACSGSAAVTTPVGSRDRPKICSLKKTTMPPYAAGGGGLPAGAPKPREGNQLLFIYIIFKNFYWIIPWNNNFETRFVSFDKHLVNYAGPVIKIEVWPP